MKRIIFTTVLSFALAASIMAQNKIWSLDDCMRYAVENSPKVKQQLYTNNTYKAEHQSAIASFLPSISTQVDAQYRFGRSVDPETNTYVNTSTFNNGYGVYASLPLFRGGQLINQWRLANVNRYMGRNDLQKQKEIPTSFGETLSWDYLCYVREHPVTWTVSTYILYGEKDNLTSYETISKFADRIGATLTVMENGEHWFHTKEQMDFLSDWIKQYD